MDKCSSGITDLAILADFLFPVLLCFFSGIFLFSSGSEGFNTSAEFVGLSSEFDPFSASLIMLDIFSLIQGPSVRPFDWIIMVPFSQMVASSLVSGVFMVILVLWLVISGVLRVIVHIALIHRCVLTAISDLLVLIGSIRNGEFSVNSFQSTLYLGVSAACTISRCMVGCRDVILNRIL